jgi:hypothetical protein
MAVASGNEFHFHHHQPQMLPEVLAVGGVNPDTANLAAANENFALAASDFTVKAAYADFGPHLDVVAPTQVPTTGWEGYRKTWSGTSAATPHVAGVAALVLARAQELGKRLSAGQVMQIIRSTATDLGPPGWDRLTGYGRVNAYAAVQAVETAPPAVRITHPPIYAPARRPFVVRGEAPRGWRLELGEGEEPAQWRTIASGRTRATRLARIDPRGLEAGGYTLRLTGGGAEERSFFFAVTDPQVRVIRNLGTSGESSPQIAGGRLYLATSDGRMRVLNGRTLRPRWTRRGGSFLATAAIGDIAGNRRPEIVAADLRGRVHAWTHRGRRVPGFPYRIRLTEPGDTPDTTKLDAAIYASPALADLNGDGKRDIVFGAADQHLYAVDGQGRDLPGWPVLARDGSDHAKILSSPAIGDLDGDDRPDVVEATAEVYGSTPDTRGRVYGFKADGTPLPGWPVQPPGLAADAIPLAGEGTPMSPVLTDTDGDGDDEMAIAAFTGQHAIYDGDGTQLRDLSSADSLAFGANAAFARIGGRLQLVGGVVSSGLILAQLSPASQIAFDHLAARWDVATGEVTTTPIEGWQIASGAAVADVSGDGEPEVLQGSSGNVLHARQADGTEPPGWPKQTAGWILAAPAAGDLDRDGRTDVAVVTRDGFLTVYKTPGQASATQWASFRHDARNSGRLPPSR